MTVSSHFKRFVCKKCARLRLKRLVTVVLLEPVERLAQDASPALSRIPGPRGSGRDGGVLLAIGTDIAKLIHLVGNGPCLVCVRYDEP